MKDSLRVRGSLSSGPVVAPAWVVGMTLTTPAGTPASASTSVSSSAVSGVSCAGLSTTVQPAARAGPILRVPMASGKFHGVMSTQGPTGRLVTRTRDLASVAELYRPAMRTASSENHRKNSAP